MWSQFKIPSVEENAFHSLTSSECFTGVRSRPQPFQLTHMGRATSYKRAIPHEPMHGTGLSPLHTLVELHRVCIHLRWMEASTPSGIITGEVKHLEPCLTELHS